MKTKLNGIDFHTYMSYGANEVIKHKEELNRINVFPVPDGDTGNNLAVTLKAMIEYSKPEASFYNTAKSISEAGIMGARGNSGVLFAQFVHGLSNNLKDKEVIGVTEFIHAADHSAVKLYQVLSNPVEGTIITVISSWVNALRARVKTYDSFEDLFMESLAAAEMALKDTTGQMEVLKANRVVDSGAKGFVLFLRGIVNYIRGDAKTLSFQSMDSVSAELYRLADTHNHASGQYRYCYECILKNATLEVAEIRKRLEPYGDSLILAGEESLMHIHLHTNETRAVTKRLSDMGIIVKPKVEDMQAQASLPQKSKDQKRIAILTDSIADIGECLQDEHPIYVIPLNLHVGESHYLDKLTIAPETFYEMLDQNGDYPTSSLAAETLIYERLEWLTQHYDSVLIISVSSALSGTYEAFKREWLRFNQPERVKLLDSRLNSGAQGLLIREACKRIQAGDSLESIYEQLEAIRSKIKIYVALRSFKYGLKSGRIPRVIGKIGSLAHLKPIVSLDLAGRGTAFSVGLSQKGQLEKIYRILKQVNEQTGIQSYVVVHAGNEKMAIEVARRAEAILGYTPETICEISSVTALHAGPGSVAVAYIEK